MSHSSLPSAMPGASLSWTLRDSCCARGAGRRRSTSRAIDQVSGMPWVNHVLVCRSCGVTSRLALVGAFGRTVLRWLDD